MKSLKIMAATIAAFGIVGTAQAGDEGQAYGNIGGSLFSSGGFDLTAIDAKLGYNFMENFGVEVEGAFGIGKDSGVKLDSHLAGFVVGKLPVDEKVDVFVRGGYFTTNLGSSFGDVDADGFAVGGGIQFFITDNDGVRVEYTYLEDNGNADQFTASYVRKF